MKPVVLIADFGDAGSEPEALRQSLEALDCNVLMAKIGRPRDFTDILAGRGLAEPDLIILSCHGAGGCIKMPVLGDEIYDAGEPRGDFGPSDLSRYCKLEGKTIISLGCTTFALSDAFARGGNTFIAPDGYVEGAGALLFAITLLYHLTQNGKSVAEAFALASGIDGETAHFRMA